MSSSATSAARACGPCTASMAKIGAFAHVNVKLLRVAANPGEILVARAGIDDQAKPGLGQKVDDEVIDHAARLVQHAAVERLARPRAAWRRRWRADSAETRACVRPSRSMTHMCETSKTPAARRTAWCSSICEAYCTGMSQPPKSTMRAPWLRCSSIERCMSSHGSSGLNADPQANKRRQSRMPLRLPPLCPVT